MQKREYFLLALAAVIVAVIIAMSPNVTAIANESSTELYGVDILGLTKNAQNLPEHQYAAQ